ncbi:hypothetical protein PG996_013311 [Apiospora saccharicola]|uniref:Uncharacterized protein n=1 Tax=Apiospora saccharicola TaxID=335842 RepID=A0ABR1U532_9PEZI
MSTSRDSTSRLRQTLNPLLTTSLGGTYGQQTPHSAISVSSPYAFSSAHTSMSSIQPYNPQEWAPSPAVGPERTHQFPTPEPPQSSPLPPPPYSPPRSQRPVSTAFESTPANISAPRVPASNCHRPSPEPPNNQNFPPPPNSGGRGASRERRFGLPSFSRRRERETSEAVTPPDTHQHAPMPRPAPLSLHIPHRLERSDTDPSAIPPSARRATSASAVETPTSARSRSTSQSRWGPGLPLPPPPPGPPPSNSRSQSLNRTTEPIASPPTRRPVPEGITALGPVPPTPADWNEHDRQPNGKQPQPVLNIDTSSATTSPQPESASASSSAGGQLSRNGAVRLEKTLRERRAESRPRPGTSDSSAGIQPLSDILTSHGAHPSRLSGHKGPCSGGRTGQDTPGTGSRAGEHRIDSRLSTPHRSAGLPPETPTPPFSPLPHKIYPITPQTHPMAPKALPTPPPQSRSASSSSARPDMPNSTGSLAGMLSSTPVTKHAVVSQTADQFCTATIERFQAFARQEATAASDADRVKLFAEFFVSESRIRRERYNSAIGAMGSEIFDLTRDLFRPMRARRDSNASQTSEWAPPMSETRSHRNSMTSVFGREAGQQQSHSAPASAGIPVSPGGGPSNNTNWQSNSNFMPSLSPILSMSISEAPDENSSRGRTASRWWEADSTGDQSQRLERSKRESKYMGVPKEAREALQWRDGPNDGAGPASSTAYEPSNEYPPEKVGWHEAEQAQTPQPFRSSLLSLPPSAPNTPSPSHLDVSRLVTLPPPYPRHHPAVNNNHPELTSIRTIVRSLSDMTQLQETKEHFKQDSQKIREEAAEAANQRRKALRVNLHQEISSGKMSYGEAAAIEADSNETEQVQAKDLDKQEFERFQSEVVRPLNEMLTTRISKATSLFNELRSRLFVDTHASDPNLPQEEGDEQPELLEKLTLLKWIFEARESLHRDVYDLLSERNDRYRDIIVTPYQQAGNEEKAATAINFFAKDAATRRLTFANEVLQRTYEFRDVVSENVERGVDMQLNAFWDIATPLKRLLERIPPVVDERFHIHIPPTEYDETPSYHEHPLQYLFSLLLHAEKSTYQFIESQTNLLCLLHEVKEAILIARSKVKEAEGREQHVVDDERRHEQEQETEDLKEKVRVVHDQWKGALGDAMTGVKERVGEWLLSTGGWDESLEDGGVGRC